MWKFQPRIRVVVLAFALGLAAFGLYLSTMAPSLGGMTDSEEYQHTAYTLGIAHPTGYPLYVLLGKLWTIVIPWGDVPSRLNLMSAFWGALTVGTLYIMVHRLTRRQGAAIVAAIALAVNPMFWREATVSDIVTFNAFLIITLLGILWLWREGLVPLEAVGFSCGLCLAHHRSTLLLLPALLFLTLENRSRLGGREAACRATLAFMVPLLLYLYLPILGNLSPWYENSLSGFLHHVLGMDASSYFLDIGSLPDRFASLLHEATLGWLTPIGASFALLGVVALAMKRGLPVGMTMEGRKTLVFLTLAFLPTWAYAALFDVAYVDRYMLIPLLVALLLMAVGVSAFMRLLSGGDESRFAGQSTLAAVGLPLALMAVFISSATARYASMDRSYDYRVQDFWEEALAAPLPSGSLIITDWGGLNAVRYYQRVEGVRPDVVVTQAASTAEEQGRIVQSHLGGGGSVYLTVGPLLPEGRFRVSSLPPLMEVAFPESGLNDASQPQEITNLRFDGGMVLVGYDICSPPWRGRPAGPMFRAGQPIRVLLYCEAEREMERDYQISLRLVDAEGLVVEQRDAMPVSWYYPTRFWSKGERVRDERLLMVPRGTPPGNLEIQIEVYESSTGQVLAPLDAEISSPVTLAAVSVERGAAEDGFDLRAVTAPTFDGRLQLLDYDFKVRDSVAGGSLDMELMWRPVDRLDEGLALVYRLADAGGDAVEERDIPLASQSYPVESWMQGEWVRRHYQLPLSPRIESGDYHLQIGVKSVSAGKLWELKTGPWGIWPQGRWMDVAAVRIEGRDRLFQAPDIQHVLARDLGECIRLMGYYLKAQSVSPGDEIHLRLYWQSRCETDTSYSVFTHLLDEEGAIGAQKDGVPAYGGIPTTYWVEGEIVADEYDIAVPPELTEGEYTIIAGMYDPQTGNRLPVADEKGAIVGDHVVISGVYVDAGG
jgi:hypothetical protein